MDRSVVSTGSVNFLNSEIDHAENRLRLSETALSNFRASYGGQLSDAESFYSNSIASDQSELATTQRDADQKAKTAQVLKQQLAQMRPMSIAEQTISNQSPLERAIAELLARRDAELAGLPGRQPKTPQHPDIVALDARISQLEQKRRADAKAPENQHNMLTKMQDNPQYQSLKLQIAEAEIARDTDQKQMQDLKRHLANNQSLSSQIPNAQRRLADKMRDYQDASALDQKLRQRRDAVQLQANLDRQTASDSLLPVGVTYAMPTTGKTKLIAMLLGSLLLGCLVGLSLVVLSEWSDHSLRYEGDAERLLGVPILASLPESADLRAAAARRALSGVGVPALPGPLPE